MITMDALIMAGGKGTRLMSNDNNNNHLKNIMTKRDIKNINNTNNTDNMNNMNNTNNTDNTNNAKNIEKPLLEINGKPMIDYVIEGLLKSNINNIYIAVSKNTPETKKYLTKKYGSWGNSCGDMFNNIFIIDTSGIDYIHDLNECIKYFSEPFMVLSCDTPTINSDIINKIIDYYKNILLSKPDVEALCVAIDKNKYIGNPTIVIDNTIPAGINILSPKYGEQKEETYIIDEPLININTLEDKAVVEEMLKNR